MLAIAGHKFVTVERLKPPLYGIALTTSEGIRFVYVSTWISSKRGNVRMRERTRRDSDSAGRQAGGRGVLRGKGPEAVRAGRVPGECAVALRGVRVKRVRRPPESCCGLPHRGGKRVRWGRGLRFALALPPALLRPRRRGQGRGTGPAVCKRLGLGQLGGGAGLLTSERVLCCSLADFRVTTICLPTLLTSCWRRGKG